MATGEIVVIQISSGALFYPTETGLINILTGEVPNNHIEIDALFSYVKHLRERSLIDYFIPMTINRYHNRYANKANPIYKKIYDIDWMKPEIKVNTLGGKVKRLLALYTTLSWTNNLIFDLVGVDPEGGQAIYKLVKTIATEGGAAILIDYNDEFKNDCTTFVKAEYLDSLQ
ncbi:MAG: hypothetical protein V4592_18350 [Bacteroidota bacterium]